MNALSNRQVSIIGLSRKSTTCLAGHTGGQLHRFIPNKQPPGTVPPFVPGVSNRASFIPRVEFFAKASSARQCVILRRESWHRPSIVCVPGRSGDPMGRSVRYRQTFRLIGRTNGKGIGAGAVPDRGNALAHCRSGRTK